MNDTMTQTVPSTVNETARDDVPNDEKSLSVGRNVKIGFFHLGSGMADVLTTGVWNRIMISDLGFAATPVGFLVSLRYFLSPVGVWAGRMSDTHRLFGLRRLFWVWLGRLLMALSTMVLGVTTAQFARGGADASGAIGLWALTALALLTFSLGNAFSASTFLALIYDRAGTRQRGRAVGIVWTFLLLGFTVGGVAFGLALPEHEAGTRGLDFSPDDLQTLFVVAGLVFAGLWFFSVLGEEQRQTRADEIEATRDSDPDEERSFRSDLALVWRTPAMRFFLFYLTLSMFFAFSQDLVLEPFAGDVFDMEARVTNRFAAYWGTMAIIGTLGFLFLQRRVTWLTNTTLSVMGVSVLVLTFALFASSAWWQLEALVMPGLLLLGLGLGMWNVGTLGLMMDLSPLGRAGTFLGFWTLAVTLSRGGGVAGGGIVRDLWLQATGNLSGSYAIVFAAGTLGLLAALYALSRVNMRDYQTRDVDQPNDTATVFAGALE